MPLYIDDVYLQRQVCIFIACELGDEAFLAYEGSGKKNKIGIRNKKSPESNMSYCEKDHHVTKVVVFLFRVRLYHG